METANGLDYRVRSTDPHHTLKYWPGEAAKGYDCRSRESVKLQGAVVNV